VNINWYIALAFCLVFFIGGRQLAEVPGIAPRARRATGFLLLLFALPALLFPAAYLLDPVAGAPWYNAFRAVNRVELLSALIAPVAGYATYRRPSAFGHAAGYGQGAASAGQYRFDAGGAAPVARVLKPVAFPCCVLLSSVSFARPMLRPLDKNADFDSRWADGILMQSIASDSGPAALMSVMHRLNGFEDDERAAVEGTYTDRAGTEFWYLARYAADKGYRYRFFRAADAAGAPVPSVARVSLGALDPLGAEFYIALLARAKDGTLTVGDPARGLLELSPEAFAARYRFPGLALAVSTPKRAGAV
jgi:hypothetical protein